MGGRAPWQSSTPSLASSGMLPCVQPMDRLRRQAVGRDRRGRKTGGCLWRAQQPRDHDGQRYHAARIGPKRHQFLAACRDSARRCWRAGRFPVSTSRLRLRRRAASSSPINPSRVSTPARPSACAGGVSPSDTRKQGAGQIDAAQPCIHRLDQAWIGVDETRRRRLRPRGCSRTTARRARPARAPIRLDDIAHLGADDAELEHVAAAGSFRDLPVDMAGDETSVVEHRLRTLERAGHRRLHQNAVGEGLLLLELTPAAHRAAVRRRRARRRCSRCRRRP